MSKRGLIIATALATMAVIAFIKAPEQGQDLIASLFTWITNW